MAVVRSGDSVKINTLSHAGATQGAAQGNGPGNEANHPVTYLAQFGVSSKQVLRDVVDFWKSGPGRPRTGRGGHILTGPVYVQDAEPGAPRHSDGPHGRGLVTCQDLQERGLARARGPDEPVS